MSTWSWPSPKNLRLPEPFRSFLVPRDDGSTQTVFLGQSFEKSDQRKPLLIYLDGSGSSSHFVAVGDTVSSRVLGTVTSLATHDFHVFGLEKRGVSFLDDGCGSADTASAEYHRYATLEYRVGEVGSFLNAALTQAAVDPSQVVLVGHSEGADVAAALSAVEPRVTHVAFLAGGGPTQFFDLMILMRKQFAKEGKSPPYIERALQQMENEFQRILLDPDNTHSLFMGHTYRRWASFARSPSIESLLKTRAKLFVAHGTEDTSVPIESFDLLAIELLRHGRIADVRRYPGYDHCLRGPGVDQRKTIMHEALQDVIAWVKR